MGSSLACLMSFLLTGAVFGQQPLSGSGNPNWNPQPVPAPVFAPLPAPPRTAIQPAFYQPPRPVVEEQQIPNLYLEIPGPGRLQKLDSEAQLQERMRQEALQRTPPERITFPDEPILSREAYLGRAWPQRTLYVEPNYVDYGRLLFEEKNSERYGWDLGAFGTLVSTGFFMKDVILFPYHRLTDPFRRYDSNAGYCLPGDPVPYMLYPPGLSVTGAVGEVGSILAILAIFP